MNNQITDNIVYRQAILADASKLSVLFKQVYIQTYATEGVSDELVDFMNPMFDVEKLQDKITHQPESLIVAVHKDNLVGVAEIAWNKKCPVGDITTAELNKLYILERFCRTGIGTGLMAEAERAIKDKGIKQLWLWVLESNERAVYFYEKAGYTWIGNAPFFTHLNRYENRVMLKELIS
jgi:GNAT superfamily N-acetyltransferase